MIIYIGCNYVDDVKDDLDNFAAGFDPLDKTEGNKKPGCSQASHVLPPDEHMMRDLDGKRHFELRI